MDNSCISSESSIAHVLESISGNLKWSGSLEALGYNQGIFGAYLLVI